MKVIFYFLVLGALAGISGCHSSEQRHSGPSQIQGPTPPPDCPQLDCANPPENCSYIDAQLNPSGCPISCGNLSCVQPTATPEPTESPEPTAEPTATPEPTESPEPTPTPTPGPSGTPSPTPSPTPVPTATPVATATPAPNGLALRCENVVIPAGGEIVIPSSGHVTCSVTKDAPAGVVVSLREVDISDGFEIVGITSEADSLQDLLPLTLPNAIPIPFSIAKAELSPAVSGNLSATVRVAGIDHDLAWQIRTSLSPTPTPSPTPTGTPGPTPTPNPSAIPEANRLHSALPISGICYNKVNHPLLANRGSVESAGDRLHVRAYEITMSMAKSKVDEYTVVNEVPVLLESDFIPGLGESKKALRFYMDRTRLNFDQYYLMLINDPLAPLPIDADTRSQLNPGDTVPMMAYVNGYSLVHAIDDSEVILLKYVKTKDGSGKMEIYSLKHPGAKQLTKPAKLTALPLQMMNYSTKPRSDLRCNKYVDR